MVSETRRLPDNVHEVTPTRSVFTGDLRSQLRYSWTSLKEWQKQKQALGNAHNSMYKASEPDGTRYKHIQILGELLGKERYPSVSIFNVKGLRKEALPIVEELIHACFPTSKVKFYDVLQKELTGEELDQLEIGGYCTEIWITDDFCISVLAHACLGLINSKTKKEIILRKSERVWMSYEV